MTDKWEYMKLDNLNRIDEEIKTLNSLGKEGWEFVFMFENMLSWSALFKRNIHE